MCALPAYDMELLFFLEQFQKKEQLKVDGKIDAGLLEALNRAVRETGQE